MASTASQSQLREDVANEEWYHTLELAPGLITPGWFDTREVARRLPIPESLNGMRCLDVGTFDGFWAFEMERRGATEVVAIDLLDLTGADWPPNSAPETIEALSRRKRGGRGFELAKHCLNSSATRHDLSVYDVQESDLGTFDFIYLGSLLLHLRDPIRALERLKQVCAGEILIVDSIDLWLTWLFPRRPTASLDMRGRPWWWTCNAAGIARLAEAAGLRVKAPVKQIFMPAGAGQPLPKPHPRLLRTESGRESLIKLWRGDPHAVVRAVPA